MTAYWIAHVTVTDPEAYKGYQARAGAALAAYGGEFLARGGAAQVLEGPELQRHVLIRFPSLDAARACHASDAYQEAKRHRDGAAIVHLTIVEGLDSA